MIRGCSQLKPFILLLLFFIAVVPMAKAKDFGQRGHVFAISEQPFLEMISDRLGKIDMAKEQKKMKAKAREYVERPLPVFGVTKAKENKSFYYDPTYVVEKDVVLPCGKLLYKAGTLVNPLARMDLNRELLFIDSDDESQIKWLKAQLQLLEKDSALSDFKKMVVLVKGAPAELEKEIDGTVYFDQSSREGGSLCQIFGISAVPAIAKQEGDRLLINQYQID